ncbi:MAG: enoyl-CoA hydratase/isomerase family protein [Frankiales bacterium]|nr:enoyl-CoA hydratase/isomerase family protein [Frankiales bacterium]
MTTELVHLDVERGVATITLDSPNNRNALSAQLRTELLAHLETAYADDAVRVVMLTHTGTVFCAGMDLKEARSGKLAGDEFPRILELLWNSPKPVVARLAGPARAGGLGLVAACDIAVAADTVTFAFTEVRIGVVPAVISATVLPRLSSRAANELFLTGETFDAARAVTIGLLNSAVAADGLDSEVQRFTDMLALGAPGALAATKTMLRRTIPPAIGDDLSAMAQLSAQHFGSAEGLEGMAAFLEKRKPSWVPGA